MGLSVVVIYIKKKKTGMKDTLDTRIERETIE